MTLKNEEHFENLANAISEYTDDIVEIKSNGFTISQKGKGYKIALVVANNTEITFEMSEKNEVLDKAIEFNTRNVDNLIFDHLNVDQVEIYNQILQNLDKIVKQSKFDYADAEDAFYMLTPYK